MIGKLKLVGGKALLVGGKAVINSECCCGISITLASFAPPSCYLLTPPGLYAAYDTQAPNVDGEHAMAGADPTWTTPVDIEDLTAAGHLYNAADCTDENSPFTVFRMDVEVTKSGATYTVTGTSGGYVVLSASGAANTPLTNTAGSGTVTVNV